MELGFERLPNALHPLIAEAKRRARRRRGLIMFAVALAIAAGSTAVVLELRTPSPDTSGSPAPAPVKLKVGWQARLGEFPVVAYGAGSVWTASVASRNNVHGPLLRLSPRTGKTIARLPVGWWPSQIAVGAGGVWVADSIGDGSRAAHRPPYDSGPLPGLANAVSRIDPRTNRVVATIHLPGVQSIVVGGGSAWATSTPLSSKRVTISRIAPRGNRVTTLRTLPGEPGALIWGGGHLWALTWFANHRGVHSRVWEIDPDTGRVLDSLVLPDGSSLTSLAYRSGLLSVVGATTTDAIVWIRTRHGLSLVRQKRLPYAHALAADGRNLWVADGNSSLWLLGAESGTVRARIALRGSVGITENVLAAAKRRAWVITTTYTPTNVVSHIVSVRVRAG